MAYIKPPEGAKPFGGFFYKANSEKLFPDELFNPWPFGVDHGMWFPES
jgi:hypothetical protein